jgi:2-phosphosulfolactate phosphatase
VHKPGLKVGIIDGRKAYEFPKSTKVLVDIFRSTTTIPYIFLGGATRVYPTDNIRNAREFHAKYPDSILVGERWGIRIRGFELNNSPYDISKADLKGKTVVFTSTNGTKVLQKIRDSGKVILGSFVNVSSVVSELESEDTVDIVVSNRPDGPADEDNYFAEYLRDLLLGGSPEYSVVSEKVRKSRGARRMRLMGYGKDLEYCLRRDACSVVPVYLAPYIIAGETDSRQSR